MSEHEIARKLRDCLVQLTDGKATEKKKQLDNLKAYLIHPTYIRHLNKSSAKGANVAERGAIAITWNKVFNKIRDYIEQELSKLRDKEANNENLSVVVRSNIDKEKRCCSDLFRCFVKSMSQNKQYEMAKPVVLHILAVLNERYTQQAFGIIYSNVFLKFILNDPFLCLHIPVETLDDAIWFYKKFIKNPLFDCNKGLTTQVLLHLVTLRLNVGAWDCLNMLDFFDHMFNSCASEKASTYHENLLQCLQLVCQNLKIDYPLRLCDVGENILLPIMQLWKTRPSEKTQELMLEFMRFQLALHHPKGVQKDKDGARAFDWGVWKNHLLSLYKLIMIELSNLCERNKYPLGKELVLKPIFVSVAIEVCAQVFIEPIDVLNITQASTSTSFDVTAPSKKRKVDVSFRALIENLSSSGKIIPWLQVISAFLMKYSSLISIPEAVCLLDALIDVHMSCNDIETKNWLLRCCQSFVLVFGSQDAAEKGEMTFQWQRVWELAIKSVALMHHCQEAGHGLLSALLSYKLVTPKTEFCNLYIPGSSNRVTKASLKSLAIFLEKFSSSSNFRNNPLCSNSLSSANFENQVLEWLFSRKNDDNSPFQVVSDDTDLSTYEIFAHVAALLCLQNSDSQIKIDVMTDFKDSAPVQWISDIENELILLTFGTELHTVKAGESNLNPPSSIISQPVWDKILKFFIEATSGIFQEQVCSLQLSTISCFIRHACLLFEMLQALYFEGIIKKEELKSNIFISHLKRSLHAVIEMFHKNESSPENVILLKDFIQRIILTIKQKEEIYGHDFTDFFKSEIMRSIPEEILKYLLNFSLDGFHFENGISENRPSTSNIDDVFEDEFAEPQNKTLTEKENDLDFDPNQERVSLTILDTNCLPENFHVKMACLQTVGEFLSLFASESFEDNMVVSQSVILQKLVSSLPDRDRRFMKTEEIHLTLQLLKCILLTKNLDDEVISKVLRSFQSVLNQMSQMQDVCQAVLKLFPHLLSQIYNKSPIASPNSSSNKTRMLFLLSVLCNRESEGRGTSLSAYLIVENLLKIVQMEPSLSWNMENRSISTTYKVSEKPGLIIDLLIKYMNSLFTPVRLLVARNVNEMISAEVCDGVFQVICCDTFDLLTTADKSNLSKKDEFTNRVSTFLHYVKHVILHFPCLETESLFMMLKLIKLKLVDGHLISVVLNQISSCLGYKSVEDFLHPRITSLSQRWFDARYKLEDFPHSVMGFESMNSFIKSQSKLLIPYLFYLGEMGSISVVAESLNSPIQEVLCTCIPSIQALILSDLALNRNRKTASKCQQTLLNCIPEEQCKQIMVAKLDELVISLLSSIKEDGTKHISLCQVFCRFFINPEEFHKAIKFIMSYIGSNGCFTSFLFQRADCIQNIFLSLNIMLYKGLRAHESQRILCMFQSFLSLLLPGLNNDSNCSIYIIREVIYSIINFLTNDRFNKKYFKRDDVCIDYSCNIIFNLCQAAVEDFKEVIGELLPLITSNLTPFVNKSSSGKKVLYLLKFLLIDCENDLVQYIPYLDPFPNDDYFTCLSMQQKQVKYKYGKLTLEQEIQFFLKSFKMMGKATKDGLNHLCHQLSSRKDDLHKILNALKEKTIFTEDVEKSILHDLTSTLAFICSTDSDFELQKAASNSLGMIGPVSFSSVVLQPSSHAITLKGHENLDVLKKSYVTILNILIEYLFNKNIDLKIAASTVLKEILSTKIGYMFFKDYSKHFKSSNVAKYAYPFFVCQNSKDLLQTCKYGFNVENLQMSIWVPNHDDHSRWIKNLVCTLLESGITRNNFYECLVPVCREETNFCEKVVPHIIHMILLTEHQEVVKFLSDGISLFFAQFSQWIEKSSHDKDSDSTPTSEVIFHKASVQTMLSVLHYIWLHPNLDPKKPRNVLKDLWLDINYLDVAQAAQYCSAHFTAILYTELWCDLEREKSRMSSSCKSNSDSESLDCSPLSFIGSQDREKASLVYDILFDSYASIGDSDAISGCDLITADSQAIVKHSYFIEKKWDGLLKLNDKQNSKLETLQALQLTGLNHTLLGYSQSLLQKNNIPLQNIIEYQCQAAWRLSQWDLPAIESSSHGFQEFLYKSQQSYVSENKPMFYKYLDLARKTVFENLINTSLESVRNILPVLSNLQLITVLEEFSNNYSNPESLKKVLSSWDVSDRMPYDDFEFVEPVSWLKCVLLNHQVDKNVNKHIILPELKKSLEKHCARARDELYLEVASTAVHTLRKLPSVAKSDELLWQMEEAKILWTKKEYSIASKILRSTLHFIEQFAKENSDFLVHYGEALTLRGKWLAETCNENSSVIMRDYLEKAVDVLECSDCTRDHQTSSAIWDAYLAVARYADGHYQSIVNYKKSTAYQMKQELMASSKLEIKKLKQTKVITEDQRKTLLIMSKQLKIDEEEMQSLEQDQKQFLNKAITSYLKCLQGTDAHDLWVFRLISLWFQNLTDEETNNIIKSRIKDLQSYKFLPLMYQLAARMGTQAPAIFTNTLNTLILRITIDHPHHALPVILALSNADKDPVDGQIDSNQPSSSQQSNNSSVKDRMVAAKKVISYLYKSKIAALTKSYASLCDAYISLAYLPVEKQTKRDSIPKDQPILKFSNFQNIPIISEEVKVDRSCEYKNLIGIHSFSSDFRMCGGITLPKVIKCLGTDGIEREQLVKGRDDLRQDAVMQQVFCLVNNLLERETETKRRRLHIRTYKVVAVSRRSGVIQWCEGTQVLSQYLVGKTGAHTRYFPNMASHLDCRKRMETIASVSLLQKKREIFDAICANYPPVFRYFFLEHFPEPSAWFERRLCYIKSVAASSIVGYILGLGDRHVNNILIDKNTAEVIHIDFGIAFEKGRVLATPETVPFRLTRDIVDGMGINAVEGTFKRCSEKTLEVMRKSQDVLLTILDVLLHDPLYEWTIPSSKSPSQTASKVESQEVNTLAERALMRLQQKLHGLEEGVAMSIEGQVNLLIQQARDPNNLCRLYAGWQPYL